MTDDDHSRIVRLEEHCKDVKKDTAQILKILNGNGREGLVTRTSLNEQSLKRLWWFVGAIALGIVAGAVGILWKAPGLLS